MIVDIIYTNCVPFQNAPQTCCLWGLLITCNNWCVSLHSDPIKVNIGGVVAWPMAHNRKVMGSSLVSAQLIPSPLAVIKANAGPFPALHTLFLSSSNVPSLIYNQEY